MAKSNKKKRKNKYINLFGTICVGILLVTILYYLLIVWIINPESNNAHEIRGTFGDLFGGINAVFTGFAFAGVIITIIMQKKELKLTRKELKKASNAQDKSQKALNAQLTSMQNSSKLNSIMSFIENESSIDKKIIAKSVLQKLTENIFFEEEFVSLVSPKFVLVNELNSLKPNISNKSKNLEIHLKNDSVECQVFCNLLSPANSQLKIQLRESPPISSSGFKNIVNHTIHRGYILKIIIRNITSDNIDLHLKYKGNFINHKWDQNLILKIEKNIISNLILTQLNLLEISNNTFDD